MLPSVLAALPLRNEAVKAPEDSGFTPTTCILEPTTFILEPFLGPHGPQLSLLRRPHLSPLLLLEPFLRPHGPQLSLLHRPHLSPLLSLEPFLGLQLSSLRRPRCAALTARTATCGLGR